MTRREFGGVAGRIAGALVLGTACHARAVQPSDGRVRARARRDGKTTAGGTSRLGLATGRDATLQVPATAGSGVHSSRTDSSFAARGRTSGSTSEATTVV